jgi:hypothetical protein
MKNNILSELSNIKIVERDKFDTPNTQIHDRWFPCLVHTLYSKVVAVILVLWVVILVLWVVILVYGWLYWSYGPKPPFSVKWYDHAIAIFFYWSTTISTKCWPPSTSLMLTIFLFYFIIALILYLSCLFKRYQWSRNCLPFQSTWVNLRGLAGFALPNIYCSV